MHAPWRVYAGLRGFTSGTAPHECYTVAARCREQYNTSGMKKCAKKSYTVAAKCREQHNTSCMCEEILILMLDRAHSRNRSRSRPPRLSKSLFVLRFSIRNRYFLDAARTRAARRAPRAPRARAPRARAPARPRARARARPRARARARPRACARARARSKKHNKNYIYKLPIDRPSGCYW